MNPPRSPSPSPDARPPKRTQPALPGPWREKLRAGKVKATPNRLRVLERFLETEDPWTLQSLHRVLARGARCDLSSVYRALADLRAAGLLEEFRLPGKRETFYSLLGREESPKRTRRKSGPHHHHHIVCEDCGKVSHLEVCLPSGFTHKVEGASGFRVTGHHLEFQGVCGDCR